MKKYGLHINGEWIESASRETFETRNPATGETLARFASGTKEDVSKAVDAAEKAFVEWKRYPAPKRGEIILKAASILRDRKEELGELVPRLKSLVL